MKAAVVLCVLLLTACGGGENPDLILESSTPSDQRVGSRKVEVLTNDYNFNFRDGVVTGSGVLRFTSLLEEIESANNFLIDFSLQDGGKLSLITNAKRELTNGFEMEFSREGESLKVIAKVTGNDQDLSSYFTDINASERLQFAIDVHNDHGNSIHLVVWQGLTEGEELLSRLIGQKGFGVFWGLELLSAEVYSADFTHPKDKH